MPVSVQKATTSSSSRRTDGGRLFQARAAVTGKVQSPVSEDRQTGGDDGCRQQKSTGACRQGTTVPCRAEDTSKPTHNLHLTRSGTRSHWRFWSNGVMSKVTDLNLHLVLPLRMTPF